MSGKIKKTSVPGKIRTLRKKGKSQKQAVAIAMNWASSVFVAPWAHASVFEDILEERTNPLFQQILNQSLGQ